MHVVSISLEGFRNFKEFTASFSEGLNVITGENAQGKTNLVEAIYYLAAGRSFRAKSERELISFDSDSARITVSVFSEAREQKLEAVLSRGRRRQLFANDRRLKSAAELSGKLRAVLFCPEDLNLVKEGAAVRRRLLDLSLCQLRPRYAAVLSEFNRALESKTRILRDHREKPSLLNALEEYDKRLSATSAELIRYRASFSALLSEKAARIHGEFSGGREDLAVRYRTDSYVKDPFGNTSEIAAQIHEHILERRRAELESGTCLSGAHKDDLEIEINGRPAREYASQGQARTAALSLKLAERKIYKEDSGEYPVLLLDDVLSELDTKRQEYVLSCVREGQVFITCCGREAIGATAPETLICIRNGKITC